ncbi:MAG: UDP-glucose/iron transport system permease protein, partial [Solirubrobacteraceae bacterium]|nr:UDP-glucose/iron transport system permease protein [Solirubrobacteraceae bacterium]
MDSGDVGVLGLLASLVLVAVAFAVSLRLRLRLERDLVVSVVRGLVQLLIVGAALKLIVDPHTPLVWSWL